MIYVCTFALLRVVLTCLFLFQKGEFGRCERVLCRRQISVDWMICLRTWVLGHRFRFDDCWVIHAEHTCVVRVKHLFRILKIKQSTVTAWSEGIYISVQCFISKAESEEGTQRAVTAHIVTSVWINRYDNSLYGVTKQMMKTWGIDIFKSFYVTHVLILTDSVYIWGDIVLSYLKSLLWKRRQLQ